MSSLINSLGKIREKRDAIFKELQDVSKQLFSEHAKEIFEQHPTLESFSWRQYTPYFNDGDICEFGARTKEFDVEFSDATYSERYASRYAAQRRIDGGLDYRGNPYPPSVPSDYAIVAIADFLKNFEDADLLAMFGDHAQITVRKDGTVDIDEYDHD